MLWDAWRVAVDWPLGISQQDQQRSIIDVARGAPAVQDHVTSGLRTASGDLRVSAQWRLPTPDWPMSTAIELATYVPTDGAVAYAGDGQLRVVPQVKVAGDVGRLAYAAEVGWRLAIASVEGGDALGDGVVFGASIGVRLLDRRLLVGPEVFGTTGLSSPAAIPVDGPTPTSGLLGAHCTLGEWQFGAGVGTALSPGTPAIRGVLSVAWSPSPPAPAPSAPPRPTTVPPPPPPPAPDPDQDGDVGAVDSCPDAPGVAVDPVADACARPEADTDHDGMPDARDTCPDVPGGKADHPDTTGCAPARARVENDEIKIVEHIKFRYAGSELLPESDAILSAVQVVLADHPEIKRLRVEGYADAAGPRAYNRALSEQRAGSVVRWLVAHGIDVARLHTQGFGEDRPVASNGSEAGRENNRRVEFHIEDAVQEPRAPSATAAPTPKAVVAPKAVIAVIAPKASPTPTPPRKPRRPKKAAGPERSKSHKR